MKPVQRYLTLLFLPGVLWGRAPRIGSFGILMARAMVDELLYNEAQNEVVFVKYLD